ncbi:hypothetical protein BUY85_07900 [Staphylococcus equorum]|uniref:hypothetical protein n=1 Tax=Staphylococcus equorum TaxID=246432 RepID=UPI000D1C6A23|nr:hypothetical protein [Staphylococcus equorum]PTE79065.1 hypothetical protein BUY85_07900 [Staphylococcus equorum]
MSSLEIILIILVAIIAFISIIYIIRQYKKDWKDRDEENIFEFRLKFKNIEISVISYVLALLSLIATIFYPLSIIAFFICIISGTKKVDT